MLKTIGKIQKQYEKKMQGSLEIEFSLKQLWFWL